MCTNEGQQQRKKFFKKKVSEGALWWPTGELSMVIVTSSWFHPTFEAMVLKGV